MAVVDIIVAAVVVVARIVLDGNPGKGRAGRQDMLWHWVELVGWLGR